MTITLQELARHLDPKYAGVVQFPNGTIRALGNEPKYDGHGGWCDFAVISDDLNLLFDIEEPDDWRDSWTPRPVTFGELKPGDWFELVVTKKHKKYMAIEQTTIRCTNVVMTERDAVNERGHLLHFGTNTLVTRIPNPFGTDND